MVQKAERKYMCWLPNLRKYRYKISNTWISKIKLITRIEIFWPYPPKCLLYSNAPPLSGGLNDLCSSLPVYIKPSQFQVFPLFCHSQQTSNNSMALNVAEPTAVTKGMEYTSGLCWVYSIVSKRGCFSVQ